MKKNSPNPFGGNALLKKRCSVLDSWRQNKFTLFYLSIFIFIISLAGCKKEMVGNQTGLDQSGNKSGLVTTTPKLPAAFKEKLANLKKAVNSNPRMKQMFADHLSNLDPQYRQMALDALNASEASCNDNTMLNQWLDYRLQSWDSDVIFYVQYTDMLNLPLNYTYFFENRSENQSFGVKGQYTKILTKTFKDLKRFWNIRSDNMVLVGMHGSMMQDRAKLIKTYNIIYEIPLPDAEYYADLVIELLQYFPQYENGNHPIFTFNAFSSPGGNFPQPIGMIPPKIVMGDGIMEGYTAIGFGDVAPQAILAHEYGHQIQFQLNLFEDEQSPEATRRTELMADAYSAYYLSHARGATMQWKRVKLFLQVFFNIGDCGFHSNGHHGTPTQRMAAAEWGYSVANNAQKQGHILTAEAFTSLFEAELPRILMN